MTSQTKLEHMARRPAEERVTPPRLETWLRESLRVLGDPQLSPREAPFHQLQAVEKTAYFELPAPLAGAEAMQLWVEWDEAPPDGERGQGEPPLRLLLGTRFSALGETRIGFLAAQEHLALRIWTEHPEHLEGELPALEAELRTCFHRVDLKVVPMGSESPSVRELIMTPGWSALA